MKRNSLKITSPGYCFIYGDTKEKTGKQRFPEIDMPGCGVPVGTKVMDIDLYADGSASRG